MSKFTKDQEALDWLLIYARGRSPSAFVPREHSALAGILAPSRALKELLNR